MKRILFLVLSLATLWPAFDAIAGPRPGTLHLGKPGAAYHAVTLGQETRAPARQEARHSQRVGPTHHVYGRIR